MPSRLLREGILDSDAVNTLSAPEEVFYRRLMSVVDDFGRFDGRASVLRGRLYPLLLDKVREADISRWIAACVNAGLIALYEHNGKQYILFHKLGSPRAKSSRYPDPPAGLEDQRADVNGCAQTKTGAPYSYSGSGTYSGSSICDPHTNKPPKEIKRFTPPTLEEVAAYCRERGNSVDPQKFIDFYASKGWLIGKSPMRDWRAAVRTWEKNSHSHSHGTNGKHVPTDAELAAKYGDGKSKWGTP